MTVAACGLLAGGGAPRQDAWRVIGPGGGGSMFVPTVSPHDPKRVLVACDMTGSYISLDGGDTWRMFNLRGTTRFFVFDPVDPDVIYTQGVGLWRSADAGQTWSLVYPDPATVSGVIMPDDHAGVQILSAGRTLPAITALAVDPADSRTLYAVIQAALHVSTDWGASWTRTVLLPDGGRQIYVDPRSPREDRTLYVIGSRSVAVREGGQWRFGPAPAGVQSFTDVSAGFPAEGGRPVVYGVVPAAVFISEDGGATWRQSVLPGSSSQSRAVATSLNHPDTAYVSYNGLRMDGATWFGVAKTNDRGGSWELMWKEASASGANMQDAWLSERFGSGWGGNPFNLGVAPTDPEICFGTDSGRTMRTTDGGKTWKGVYSARAPGAGWDSTGLDVTTNYGIHWDPFDPKRVFISYTDIGLFGSEDGGKSWFSATNGVPRRWVNTTYWIEFDPAVRGRVWGVMSRVHDLPRPKMWRQTAPATYEGGVCLSEDGGRTWRESTSGMDLTAATHILLDPTSPAEARVLYVAGFGRGVYKSTDGGQTWALKNNGIEGAEPFAWWLARDRDGVLYLVVARRTEDGSFNNQGDGALYRSTDGAETWRRIALPPGVNGPNGLLIDPDDPQRLYLAAWGRRTSAGARDGGIFLSTDGGQTWRNVLAGDQHVYDVTIDTRNGALYAAGFESAAWRSTDRGETWQRIRGYNFKWGHRVIPDPLDPEKVYVTTFGGSVWHGPAAGDPEAVEDIVTPALSLTARADVWAPLRFLVGRWEGKSSGKPGAGAATREYRFELGGKYLVGKNRVVYEKETHEDWSIFSFDRLAKRFALRQFHVEGFVNEYSLAKAGGDRLELLSERIENIAPGWRAREQYSVLGPDEFVETFSLAAPGRDFEPYSESRLKRAR